MDSRGVVITVYPLRLIVGMRFVECTAHNVTTVNAPGQALPEGFLAIHHIEMRHGILLLMPVRIDAKQTEQHTVDLCLAESFAYPFQSIRPQPVVTVYKADVISRCTRQSDIPRMSLSPVLIQCYHPETCVPGRILMQDIQRVIRRSIINADHLNVFQRLVQQRIKAMRKEFRCVIDGDEHTNLWHDG